MIEFSAKEMHFPTIYPNPELLNSITAASAQTTPAKVKDVLGELRLPNACDDKPYLFGCMVLSFDGKMGFKNDPEGTLISKENRFDTAGALTDFWMMNVCRCYADAVIMGTGTLRARLHKLWYAQVLDEDLVKARAELSKQGANPQSLIASIDGKDLPLEAQILSHTPAPIVFTSLQGARYLQENLQRENRMMQPGEDLRCDASEIRIVAAGEDRPNTKEILKQLRAGGLEHISVEAPGYVWHLLQEQCLDEYFLNYSGVMAGGDQFLGGASAFGTENHPHVALLMLGYHKGFIFTRQKILYNM